ncbi:type IV pilin protein [Vibrio sp.]|uniref:type IV pilin protein n=1 Tax=Vibrio sp. TaxID=678 RepID=UPI00311F968B
MLVNRCKLSKKSVKAMTLIELLFVVALIGLLALFAYPNYQQQIRAAHRTTAISDLTKLQLEIEHGYNQGYHWEGLISNGKCLICRSEPEHFVFEIQASTNSPYVIKAIAQEQSQQTLDSCLIANNANYLSLDANNREFPSGCWQ